jgi:hypothetical protein
MVLHTSVKFSEKLIPRTLAQNIVNIGNRYCLHQMILFSWCKFLIQHTLPSFLGVMNEGEAHSLSCCGAKTPILTRWSSSILKVLNGFEVLGKA